MENIVLKLDNITKIYGNGFIANKDVTLSIREGEIHALMGENGAGKTTLMKVLFGIEKPDEGTIYLRGKEVKIENPQHAISLGIGMVHQHFMLVPSLTVAENIVLGMEPKTMGNVGLLDMKKAVEMTNAICKEYNFDIDPLARVQDLPVGEKQKVEILKALIRGAKILILDEPTAVLTPQETEQLFAQLNKLREKKHTIIFISHKLAENKAICDRISILRHGKWVATRNISEVSEDDISRLMVGRDVVLKFDKEKANPKGIVLRTQDLSKKDKEGKLVLNNVNLVLKQGQILGVAGVEGNGQKELSECITGMEGFEKGDILVNDGSVKGKSIRQIREMGVAHISEDRMTYGCAQDGNIWENVVSDRYYKKEYQKRGVLKKK